MKPKLCLSGFLMIICLIALSNSACQNNEKTEALFEPLPFNELVTTISDTDASPEQLALKRKVEDICYFKTEVKDNHLVLTVDKDYFIQNNIPVGYYDLIVEQIEANNKCIDEFANDGIKIDVAETFEKSRNQYKAYIKEFEKSRITVEEFLSTYKD